MLTARFYTNLDDRQNVLHPALSVRLGVHTKGQVSIRTAYSQHMLCDPQCKKSRAWMAQPKPRVRREGPKNTKREAQKTRQFLRFLVLLSLVVS